MKPLSTSALRKLKLEDAIENEAMTQRNLLPVEEGWQILGRDADKRVLAELCVNQLKAGHTPAPQVIVAARKPGHGVRPIPYWGPLERVMYRALATAALDLAPRLDRSPEAYTAFAFGPVTYAHQLQKDEPKEGLLSNIFYFLDTPIHYVVKADISSFYQYVDHSILSEELLLQGGDYEIVDALVELLFEIQGRSFGIPQLFDASDDLSEIYIDRVERGLLRMGYPVWRFNDDFRIACRDYPEAIRSIEALDQCARDVGLAISEHKTVTVGFEKYMLDSLGLRPSDDNKTISIDDVEVVVGDYIDEFGEEDTDRALEVLTNAQDDGSAGGIDLRSLRADNIRLIRRALNGLARFADPRGIPELSRIVVYAPSITPDIMRYLEAVHVGARDGAVKFLDQLRVETTQNDWQKLWLINTMRRLELLAEGEPAVEVAPRRAWIHGVKKSTSNAALRAEAALALAAQGWCPFEETLADAERCPQPLLPSYTAAVREAISHTPPAKENSARKQADALKRQSVLHRLLMADLQPDRA